MFIFRSQTQTSDNMDRWKTEVEQKNREEKSRREKIREEKESEDVRRKKLQVREKVGKSRNTVFPTQKWMNIFFTGDLYFMYVFLQGIAFLPCIRVYRMG